MSSDASTLPPSLEVYDERIRKAVVVESTVESGFSIMIPKSYQAPLLVLVSQSVCFLKFNSLSVSIIDFYCCYLLCGGLVRLWTCHRIIQPSGVSVKCDTSNLTIGSFAIPFVRRSNIDGPLISTAVQLSIRIQRCACNLRMYFISAISSYTTMAGCTPWVSWCPLVFQPFRPPKVCRGGAGEKTGRRQQ